MTGTIVAGIGQTEFSKESGRSTMQLAAEAGLAAIRDAGLEAPDIDGLVTFTVDENDELTLMRALGIPEVHYWARSPGAGYGASATVQLASGAISSGSAKAVLIYRAFNERSGRRFGQPSGNRSARAPLDFHFTYGIDTPAKMYALWFRRYMHEYGISNEDFGRYVVAARRYAATNPNAWSLQPTARPTRPRRLPWSERWTRTCRGRASCTTTTCPTWPASPMPNGARRVSGSRPASLPMTSTWPRSTRTSAL
jgi:acetyl-CoA acetyltransferase